MLSDNPFPAQECVGAFGKAGIRSIAEPLLARHEVYRECIANFYFSGEERALCRRKPQKGGFFCTF